VTGATDQRAARGERMALRARQRGAARHHDLAVVDAVIEAARRIRDDHRGGDREPEEHQRQRTHQ
jgi:hypothetical protein